MQKYNFNSYTKIVILKKYILQYFTKLYWCKGRIKCYLPTSK